MGSKPHRFIPGLIKDYKEGLIDRRTFLRYAALLGISVSAAGTLAGFSLPKPAFAGTPKRGGELKVSCKLQKITHPAQYSWIEASNVTRQVAEYLTYTGGDNVTKPYLLKNWAVSDDLMVWTLNLRDDVSWNNGQKFTAEDVAFSINQWLNPDVKSSIRGLMGNYLDPSGIKIVGDYKVELHLTDPEIAVPEHLFHYPAQVLNAKTFNGDFLKNPVGTGPFTLESYEEGTVAVLKARKDYWMKGTDGKPQPYLDSVRFFDVGTAMAPHIAALKSGEVHLVDNSDGGCLEVANGIKSDPETKTMWCGTSGTRVLRMRVDRKPYDDNRVRMALKLCQHREKILALAYENKGIIGQDVHIYKNHPEYAEIPTPKYDPARAKKLLAEAGYPNGIKLELAVGTDWPEVVRNAEVLKQDSKAAGIDIVINPMPTSQYWEKWTEVPLGISPWAHRPLGTMFANLAYTVDKTGKPVPWNESRWVNDEYNALLKKANATVDAKKRSKIMAKMEKIQQEEGSIGVPYFMNVAFCMRKEVNGISNHPNLYYMCGPVWLEG